MQKNILHTSTTYLKGVGVAKAELLHRELGIWSIADLLRFFPFRYIDRTQFYKIKDLQATKSEMQIVGQITDVKMVGFKRGSRLEATFSDETGNIKLTWFKGIPWIKKTLQIQTPYVIFGRVNKYGNNLSIAHPEMELLEDYKNSIRTSLQPVYPSTEKLIKKGASNRWMQKVIQQILIEYKTQITETLSDEIIKKHQLISKEKALFQIHFPESQELLAKAEHRLKFEELFFVQLQLLRNNLIRKNKIKGYPFEKVGSYFNDFYKNHLPFDLTSAQKKVIKEIRNDLGSVAQMNRLLQGDVGSGKTIVAFLTALIALDNNFQVAFMAPTEILANQHYNAIKKLVSDMDIAVSLLTGSVKTKARKVIHKDLESGELNILIGTHALIEDKVKFKNLGLVIIDEQHRFGVAQRAKMWKKNILPPHILVMTATPIPRTLAMSVYGDLDISIIDELPPGRKEIKTVLRFDKNRMAVFQFIREEIAKGRQVYIVYPLIEESDAFDYKDLMDGYESISREFPRPKYQVSIVHGKMKPADKEYEMQQFIKGNTQILVATTVIEVGVNVPNASVMIIESAEKFGLSQLHQLRGRVGRGSDQSYCILMASHKLTHNAKTRLSTMVATSDGFKIAEVDLNLRGPGNLMGTQQSGVLNLKIADIVKDKDLLKLSRFEAQNLISEDPNIRLEKNAKILATYKEIERNTGAWGNIS